VAECLLQHPDGLKVAAFVGNDLDCALRCALEAATGPKRLRSRGRAVVKLLLEAGLDIRETDEDGLLLAALEAREREALRAAKLALLAASSGSGGGTGAGGNAAVSYRTQIINAASKGDSATLREILGTHLGCVALRSSMELDKGRPVTAAALGGHLEALGLLLSARMQADPDAGLEEGGEVEAEAEAKAGTEAAASATAMAETEAEAQAQAQAQAGAAGGDVETGAGGQSPSASDAKAAKAKQHQQQAQQQAQQQTQQRRAALPSPISEPLIVMRARSSVASLLEVLRESTLLPPQPRSVLACATFALERLMKVAVTLIAREEALQAVCESRCEVLIRHALKNTVLAQLPAVAGLAVSRDDPWARKLRREQSEAFEVLEGVCAALRAERDYRQCSAFKGGARCESKGELPCEICRDTFKLPLDKAELYCCKECRKADKQAHKERVHSVLEKEQKRRQMAMAEKVKRALAKAERRGGGGAGGGGGGGSSDDDDEDEEAEGAGQARRGLELSERETRTLEMEVLRIRQHRQHHDGAEDELLAMAVEDLIQALGDSLAGPLQGEGGEGLGGGSEAEEMLDAAWNRLSSFVSRPQVSAEVDAV